MPRCFLSDGPFGLASRQQFPQKYAMINAMSQDRYGSMKKQLKNAWSKARTTMRPSPDTPIDAPDSAVRSRSDMPQIAASAMSGRVPLVALRRIRIRKYEVPLYDLPPELDGTRIVHISDTHYGPYTGLMFLHEVARRANALEPDVVVFTGDYVHLTPRSIKQGIEVLTRFHSRFGSVAVLGNHEHSEGADVCRRVFRRIGLPLIDNSRLFLTPNGLSPVPTFGKSLCLAGVGDYIKKDVSFDSALHDVPGDMPRIVLSHNPDAAELVGPNHRVDLMLSGHTHGGQIRLPGIGAPWNGSRHGKKYLGGLCQGPRCPVLVSRGIGIAFIPVRFRVPPELVLIVLHTAGDDPGPIRIT